jgi:hypothetical protein
LADPDSEVVNCAPQRRQGNKLAKGEAGGATRAGRKDGQGFAPMSERLNGQAGSRPELRLGERHWAELVVE